MDLITQVFLTAHLDSFEFALRKAILLFCLSYSCSYLLDGVFTIVRYHRQTEAFFNEQKYRRRWTDLIHLNSISAPNLLLFERQSSQTTNTLLSRNHRQASAVSYRNLRCFFFSQTACLKKQIEVVAIRYRSAWLAESNDRQAQRFCYSLYFTNPGRCYKHGCLIQTLFASVHCSARPMLTS